MSKKLNGVVPAMITPFTEGGREVDYDKARGVASHLAKAGVHGLFLAGTTGEGMLLSLDERKRLLEEVIDEVGDKLNVIAHTGTLDTLGACELSAHAFEVNAAGVAVMTPAFFRLDEAAIIDHYRDVAASVGDNGIMLYNIPGLTKNPLSPALILKLANEIPNIIGLKESGGRMQHLNMILAARAEGFTVFNGVDEYSAQALITGADGSVASTANVVPQLFLGIYNAVQANDYQTAWEHQKTLIQACGFFHYGAMLAYYKEGLRLLGVDPGHCRKPTRVLTKSEADNLARGLESIGVI